MKVIAVFSLKGGVGKTTVAVNLAHAAAAGGGRRTLLWDLDAQGAASFILGNDKRKGPAARRYLERDSDRLSLVQSTTIPGLSLLPADKSLRHVEAELADVSGGHLGRLLGPLEQHFDRVILDCPPGFTNLAEQVFRAADLLVEPIAPAPLAERAHAALIEHLAKHHKKRPPILPVFSMLDRRRALHRAAAAAHPDRPALPYASIVERMSSERAPVAVLAPVSPAARAFAELWAATERRLLR